MSEQIVKRKRGYQGRRVDDTIVREVLGLLRDGMRVAEIAEMMGISKHWIHRLKKIKLASGELKPRATGISQTFVDPEELAEMIGRLEARVAVLEAADTASRRARAQLCRELRVQLSNAAARSALLAGRRTPVRRPRENDIVINFGAAA